MTRVYYREAVGALVVFDMTRASTFQAVLKWKGDLDSKVALSNGRPVPAVLLANKSDQQKHGLCSKLPKLETFSKDHGFIGCYKTSAKVTGPEVHTQTYKQPLITFVYVFIHFVSNKETFGHCIVYCHSLNLIQFSQALVAQSHKFHYCIIAYAGNASRNKVLSCYIQV